MMAVKSLDDSVSKLYVVPGVHSVVRATVSSDASGAVVDAAHRHDSSHSSHSSLLDLTHVTVTISDAAVHLDVLSWQHVHAHLGIVASLKFAVPVVPSCGHVGSNVV